MDIININMNINNSCISIKKCIFSPEVIMTIDFHDRLLATATIALDVSSNDGTKRLVPFVTWN